MGKRVATALIEATKVLSKRKCNSYLNHHHGFHGCNEEDSPLTNNMYLSNLTNSLSFDAKLELSNPPTHLLNASLLGNSSDNYSNNNQNSLVQTESPRPVYTLRPSIVNGTVLTDLTRKQWRLGRPIGKGNFGEIFLASDNVHTPVTNENAGFVVKIEPHSNGPLFVEIHCLMNTARRNLKMKSGLLKLTDDQSPSGIPDYIASGSHYFAGVRYRFLVLPRFDRDLHSLIKKSQVHQKCVLKLAIQIVNVLENLHNKGYCHNDIKAQNLMISRCKYYKPRTSYQDAATIAPVSSNQFAMKMKGFKKYNDEDKQHTTDSGNSTELDMNDADHYDVNGGNGSAQCKVKNGFYMMKDCDFDEGDERNDAVDVLNGDDEDEDFDDATSNSMNSNNMDVYCTPKIKKHRRHTDIKYKYKIEYGGSNPVRSCRLRQKPNSIYDEMVNSHYLRPVKRISYSEFFADDFVTSGSGHSTHNSNGLPALHSSDEESEEFLPTQLSAKKMNANNNSCKRLTRRQQKLNTNGGSAYNNVKADNKNNLQQYVEIEEEHIFLIDFGLASKYIDNGEHRPFIMDQRRAHDGTLEFTSRDAHMGAHSRRSDMECLGYNLLFWSQGYLPWKDAANNHQQERVHWAKEYLMLDVRELLPQIYGRNVPKYLGEFLYLVGQLSYHQRPDYEQYRRLFENEYHAFYGSPLNLQLSMLEIQQTCKPINEKNSKTDFFDITKNTSIPSTVLSIQNSSITGTPNKDRSNRVSPKNLRSKTLKKASKNATVTWSELLSQDPDQIARNRAEKEFERQEQLCDLQQSAVRRYQGKPTYAILRILHRLRLSGRLMEVMGRHCQNEQQAGVQQQHQHVGFMKVDDCEGAEINHGAEQSHDSGSGSDTAITKGRPTKIPFGNSNRKTPKILIQNGANSYITSTPIDNPRKRKRLVTKKLQMNIEDQEAHPSSKHVGRAIKGTLKSTSTSASTGSTASTDGELDGHQQASNCVPRLRRTRRCISKSCINLLEDESNSNSTSTPIINGVLNAWQKISNEQIYFYNYKK